MTLHDHYTIPFDYGVIYTLCEPYVLEPHVLSVQIIV